MENAKSKGFVTASRLVFYIGLGVCLLIALVGLVMTQLGYEIPIIGEFRVDHLFYIGVGVAVFVIIAIILRIAALIIERQALKLRPVAELVEEEEFEPSTLEKLRALLKGEKKIAPETKEQLTAAAKGSAPLVIAIVITAVFTSVIGKKIDKSRKMKARRNLLDFFD